MKNKLKEIISTIIIMINMVVLVLASITGNPFLIGCSLGIPIGHLLFLFLFLSRKQGKTFRDWLKENPQDINTFEIDCGRENLIDLNGIQEFKNLEELDCSNNKLTSLNLEGLVNLQGLDCSNNQLRELPLEGLVNLQGLNCSNNQLRELPLEGLVNLVWLGCTNNQLQELPLEGLVNLKQLYCQGNQLPYNDLDGYWSWWEKEYPDRAEAKKFNF